MEERELPAVERLEDVGVGRGGDPLLQLGHEPRAEWIEARRFPRRKLCGERRHRSDAVGAPVEPLEEDGSRRERPGGGEAKGGHGAAEFRGRLRHEAGGPVELALELEDERPVDLTAEVAREEARRLGPGRGELAARGRPHAEAAAELDRPARRQTDERRERRVGAGGAEEGALELGVRALECGVLPVEAAAGLGRSHEERHEDRPPKRLVLPRALARMGAREDPGRRLVLQGRERGQSVLTPPEPLGPRLDERADQGAVLVESRAVRRRVLLERHRDVRPGLDLGAEVEEGAQAERVQGAQERGRSNRRGHGEGYAPARPVPASRLTRARLRACLLAMRFAPLLALSACALALAPVGAGGERPTCGGRSATIVGTAGSDTIHATGALDVIVSLGGADTIYAHGGDDIVCAGTGNDRVYGGPGWDGILGQGGNDLLLGAGGGDYLSGGRGVDRAVGGAGNDSLEGGSGADALRGGLGGDQLWGRGGRDSLFGEGGNDRLDGGADSDRCDGGAGRDDVTTCETGPGA